MADPAPQPTPKGTAFATACVLTLFLVAGCEDRDGPYRGTTDQRRITREGDWKAVYAKPVPGGCIYASSIGMAFAPHPCAEDAARWNRPQQEGS